MGGKIYIMSDRIFLCAERWSKVSKTSLKKNNNELAKALNKCKLALGRRPS